MNIIRCMTAKTWGKGGLIGACICAALFVFHYLIYFPVILRPPQTDAGTSQPIAGLVIPTLTGHTLPLFTQVALEGSSITEFLCTENTTECRHWSLEYEANGVPWTNTEGGAGYCLVQETVPLSACVERVQIGAFLLAVFLLESLYFFIGAIVATFIEQQKHKR